MANLYSSRSKTANFLSYQVHDKALTPDGNLYGCHRGISVWNICQKKWEKTEEIQIFIQIIFSFSNPIPTEFHHRRVDLSGGPNCLQGIQAGLLGTSLQLNSDLVLSEKAW